MNITSKYIYKLKYFKTVDGYFEVKGGRSGAKTFCVISDGQKYFVKFRKWVTPHQKNNFKIFANYVNTPKIYNSGKVDGVQYYIAEYIGDKARQISKQSCDEIYAIAKGIGATQKKMAESKKISSAIKKRVYKDFYRETSDIYSAAIKLYNKTKDSLDVDVSNFYGNIFTDIERWGKEYLELFKTADAYYCHSDFKTDNFFLVDNDIMVVDFEESYYGYLPFMCRAYPYELMNTDRTHNEEWYFTKGIIDSFYETMPDKLNRQFVAVLYRAISQYFTTRIDKPDKLKKFAHNLSLNMSRVSNMRELFDFQDK